MTTRARFRALAWFADHEALGPDGVFDRRPPTNRMRKLMVREDQVMPAPIGQFKYQQWRLTPHGRAVLANKPRRKQPGRTEGDGRRRASEAS